MNFCNLEIYTTLLGIVFSCSVCIYWGFSPLSTLCYLVVVLLAGESIGLHGHAAGRARVVIYGILGEFNCRSGEVLGSIPTS